MGASDIERIATAVQTAVGTAAPPRTVLASVAIAAAAQCTEPCAVLHLGEHSVRGSSLMGSHVEGYTFMAPVGMQVCAAGVQGAMNAARGSDADVVPAHIAEDVLLRHVRVPLPGQAVADPVSYEAADGTALTITPEQQNLGSVFFEEHGTAGAPAEGSTVYPLTSLVAVAQASVQGAACMHTTDFSGCPPLLLAGAAADLPGMAERLAAEMQVGEGVVRVVSPGISAAWSGGAAAAAAASAS